MAEDPSNHQVWEPQTLGRRHKEKIRDAMSAVFNHAIRWEFTDTNPITGPHKGSGVRVSGKRERTPEILDVEEMQPLLASLRVRERAMVFLDMPAGLRRGEWPASNGRMWTSSICILM